MRWLFALYYTLAIIVAYVNMRRAGFRWASGLLDWLILLSAPISVPIAYLIIPIMDFYDKKVDGREE